MNREELVSGEQVGRLLGVSHRTVTRWIGEERVPYYRIGKTVRFDLKRILDHSLVDPHRQQRE